MNLILETQQVSFHYPGTEASALKGLSMGIPSGKKVAICGHNGSGKSTFFLHAIGIHRPATGTVLWHGEPMSYKNHELQKLRQRIGLVFQDPEHQLILSTPFEDIAYGLRNAGVPESDVKLRTQRMLAALQLEPLADKPLHHLSLGQKKRVALAGVLVQEPELLLLDEPTAYLDRASEQQLIGELERVHASGITVVMATHDMNLAYAWADWILVMNRGACIMEGTPVEVFEQKARLGTLGLEQPLMLELWQALPASLRSGTEPPRRTEELKQLFGQLRARETNKN